MKTEAAGVLDGMLVVEMSEVFQAPLAAQTLGDLGADVIKIERAQGEILRHMDVAANACGGMSSYYAATNRNKRSVCLDIKTPAGRRDLLALLARADVFVHNYRPGALERQGLGYEDLKKINPRLVYAWATGFGETGPMAGAPGQDFVLQSLTGMAMGSADSDGIPRFSNTPSIDFASGMVLAQGVLAALLSREKSGVGQKVSTSLLDTAIAMQSLAAASELMYQFETNWFARGLNFVFRTSDGWLTVLGFFRENPLSLMCRAAGLEDLSMQEGYGTTAGQIAHRDEIRALLEGPVARMTRDEAYRRFSEVDILCAPALTLAEALKHPQVRQNGMVVDIPIPGQGDMPVTANPLRLSATPLSVRRGPPALNADLEEVRKRWMS